MQTNKLFFMAFLILSILLVGCTEQIDDEVIMHNGEKGGDQQEDVSKKDVKITEVNEKKTEGIEFVDNNDVSNLELTDEYCLKDLCFNYPKSWYVYDDVDESKCEPVLFFKDVKAENTIVLSKTQLDQCEVGFSWADGYELKGDVLLRVDKLGSFGYDDFKDHMDDEKYLKYNPGTKEIQIGGINFIKHPALKNSEGPRPNTTRFYGKNSEYNYYLEVNQLDRDGNIDPELMKVVESIFIKGGEGQGQVYDELWQTNCVSGVCIKYPVNWHSEHMNRGYVNALAVYSEKDEQGKVNFQAPYLVLTKHELKACPDGKKVGECKIEEEMEVTTDYKYKELSRDFYGGDMVEPSLKETLTYSEYFPKLEVEALARHSSEGVSSYRYLFQKSGEVFTADFLNFDDDVQLLKQIIGTVKSLSIDSPKNELETDGELIEYKNEKYNYSFKYPKDWYFYEYSDYKDKCPTDSPAYGEGAITLSRTKLEGCEIVGDGSRNSMFGGDIIFWARDKRGAVHPVEEKINYGREEVFIGNGIRSLKTTPYPSDTALPIISYKFRAARFDYGIMFKSKDRKNIDQELAKFLDNIVIEDYFCEKDSDCVIKEEKDTCLECDKKMVCVNEYSEVDKVKPMCSSPKNYETCINSVVPTGCQCVNNRCESN